MKKILFALQTMVMGGVEKELITVLQELDSNEIEATVLVMYEQDASIMQKIPSWVKVINLNIDRNYYCADTWAVAKQRIKKGRIFEAFSLIAKKLLKIGQTGSNINIKNIPSLDEKYDTAVCYHIHSPLTVKYIAKKVKAKKKVGWIHNDFTQSGYRPDKIKKYLNCYDLFVAVSEKIKLEFLNLCPAYASKTKTVHNFLNQKEIIDKSLEPIKEDYFFNNPSRLSFLTVGRLESQKGYDIAIGAAKILKTRGINFLWCFVGSGKLEAEISKQISDFDLCDNIKLLGRKENPYSYMKNCDIYIQPSRHEGYCLTVIEAKILAKPIVITDFAGANEQIKNGVNGIIVPCNDIEKIADAIMNLANNSKQMLEFSRALEDERRCLQGFDQILECL